MLASLFGRQSSQDTGEGMTSTHEEDEGKDDEKSIEKKKKDGVNGVVNEATERGSATPPIPAPRRQRPAPPRPISISSVQSVTSGGVSGSAPSIISVSPAQNLTLASSSPAFSTKSQPPIQQTHPLCLPTTFHTMSGWIHKVETRPLLGVITRKRYWFALAEGSPYLYWFKDRSDVQCVGRISLSGAAFTFDAREKGKFTIHASNEEHVFETGCNTMRDDWMKALQETRKRSWNTHIDIDKEIHALTSATPSSPFEQSVFETSLKRNEEKRGDDEVHVSDLRTPSVDELLAQLGPTTSRDSEDTMCEEEGEAEDDDEGGSSETGEEYDDDDQDVTVISDGRARRPMSPPIPIPPTSPSAKFYVAPDGSLNENSFEMPKEILGAEEMLHRLAERTTDGIERPTRRAIDRAKNGLRELKERAGSVGGTTKECDHCKKLVDALADSEGNRLELEELIEAYEERTKSHRKALMTATRQLETMKRMSKMSREDEEEMMLMLEKEKELTLSQMKVNELQRRLQDAEEQNRQLETTVSGLQADVEAFRDSVRTKEELIMRLAEQNDEDIKDKMSIGGDRRGSIIGDVEVPEGIAIEDGSCFAVDEEARRIYEEQAVRDVHEMRDLVEGYRLQNESLNNEIVELHNMLTAYEERERKLTRVHFETQACYYQLKSRYIMVLNHFKSPEKPGKIMEPGVLRELIDEANRTPRSARKDDNAKATDKLGFYVEGSTTQSNGGHASVEAGNQMNGGDMFENAADCQRKADELIEASKLEQSEEYMKWLQSWDAFLVNSVNTKNTIVSSTELKALVRTGIPLAHRARVWIRLVSLQVRERQAEMGNGYFECMLRKARKKKEEGVFDAAIKQIDLDLARTLPTNKFFEDPSSEKVESLRRVLYAYRYHNAEVGYCQGLNRLAAIGLLYLSEEDAFWFLTSCVEMLQPPGYYTCTLIGAVADQKVLRDLVQEKLPRLANHLKTLEVDLSLFTLSWFLTCFVDVLPHSIYLNIFDVFLYEGNKVLFRFALAILKLGESRVLQCRTIGTVHACLSRAADFVPNFKKLAQVAFYDLNPFPQKSIEQKRQMYLNQLKDQGYR